MLYRVHYPLGNLIGRKGLFNWVSSRAGKTHLGDWTEDEGVEEVGEKERDVVLKGTLQWPFPVPLLFGAILPFRVIQATQ